MEYLKRITDGQLSLRLEAFGVVQIKSPRLYRKTTTVELQAKSVIKMQDPDTREGYLAAVRTKQSLLLKGDTPRLIDEWHVAPVLWDAIRSLELNPKIFSFIYEYLCMRDLKVYSQALGGRLSYTHNLFGLEADAILHLDNGRYALIGCLKN